MDTIISNGRQRATSVMQTHRDKHMQVSSYGRADLPFGSFKAIENAWLDYYLSIRSWLYIPSNTNYATNWDVDSTTIQLMSYNWFLDLQRVLQVESNYYSLYFLHQTKWRCLRTISIYWHACYGACISAFEPWTHLAINKSTHGASSHGVSRRHKMADTSKRACKTILNNGKHDDANWGHKRAEMQQIEPGFARE